MSAPTIGLLPAPERLPRAAQRRAELRRFIITTGEPVSLLQQVNAVTAAYLSARLRLRRRVRHLSPAARTDAIREIDALRAARATLARLTQAEAVHVGAGLPPHERVVLDDAIADQPTALELAP